jgi:tetratricopeptide (TPR) repeat protein
MFPNGHEVMGDFYFRNRKFDQALQQYKDGITDDSKHALIYKERIINLDIATNRRDDALNLARTIAKDNPKDLRVNELYAGLLLQSGSRDAIAKSLNDLKDLVKTNGEDALLHLDLSRAYFETNEKDKSLSEAQDAMQAEIKQAQNARPPRAPRSPIIVASRLIMGRIYADRGQNAKAIEQANLVLQADSKNADARLIKARAMVGIGQGDEALPELQALVEQYPAMGGARLELANLYRTKGEFDKATAEYSQFVKQNPADVRGAVGLESVKLAQGKADEAISGLQALVNQRPNDLQLRYQLATFQAQAGAQIAAKDRTRADQYFQAAAGNYKEILKTTANSLDVWLRLGILQRELKQYDAALASFQQASAADPHNASPILNEAMLLEGLGKKKEAITAYNKVLGIDPDNPLAMNNVAFLNAEDGVNLDQAMTFAEKAKQRFPNSPDISDTLGYVYYQKHLNTEALQIFRDLVAAHQNNPTFLFHLALALQKNGDKGAARDEARKALQFSTEKGQQNQIKSFLNQLG